VISRVAFERGVAVAAASARGLGHCPDVAGPARRRARPRHRGPSPPPAWDAFLAWGIEAHIVLPLLGAALLYRWAVGVVRRSHPDKSRARANRVWSWYLGLLVIFIALESPIGTTTDTPVQASTWSSTCCSSCWAAPLLAIGAPITLLLRVASPALRVTGFGLPLLHSRVRARAGPSRSCPGASFARGHVGESLLGRCSTAALTNDYLHLGEATPCYLGSALLFWWAGLWGAESIALAPAPPGAGRLPVFLGMPQSSFLGLAIFFRAPPRSMRTTRPLGWGSAPAR